MKPHVALMLVAAVVGPGVARAGSTDVERLLDAIAAVESNRNPHAIGDRGRAVGVYQIHKLYWQDGTRILGVDWGYEEAKDPVKARQVVRAYLLHYGRGRSLLDKARIHNGGPRGYRKKATASYAQKVAQAMEQQRETS